MIIQAGCLLKMNYITSNSEDTIKIGENIGKLLIPGSIVALRGKLGAGKTVLARGIARALGVSMEINSPSYTIINEYEARNMPFYHIDTYRLLGDEDFRLAGGEEILFGSGVCVIEWPEKISLPSNIVNVEIDILPDGNRHIHYKDIL